ncbi:hypothetical protein CVT24_004337 [Panaeolus cyanescens]|uniref:KN homeodomain domain-containing protein n=1 Tax=Panaeolus cyanescens TaxID=181874 RepID=A0A409VDE2_9AGAR|nr:hypothetical protein CVT24_004337 [Panaeolus cyanescens]
MSLLRQKLLEAEEAFLLAVSQGPEALVDFGHSWSELQMSLEIAMEGGTVEDEVVHLAHHVFTAIEVLAARFLELEEDIETFTEIRQAEISNMISDLSLEDGLSQTGRRQSIDSSNRASNPPYLVEVHKWLMNNLHNPYPNKQQKKLLAESTSSSVKDIESWFISARKQIGWTRLCAESFNNKRAAIVRAATCYFASQSQGDDGASSSAYHSDFFCIQRHAEELIGSMGTTFVSPSPSSIINGYPSPVHSPKTPRQSSLPAVNDVRIPRKRHASSISTDHDSPGPNKRSRLSYAACSSPVETYLPTPAASPSASASSSALPLESPGVQKRKRSGNDDEQTAKRPCLGFSNATLSSSLANEGVLHLPWCSDNALELQDTFPPLVTTDDDCAGQDARLDIYQYSFSPSLSDLCLEELSSPTYEPGRNALDPLSPSDNHAVNIHSLLFDEDPWLNFAGQPYIPDLNPLFQHSTSDYSISISNSEGFIVEPQTSTQSTNFQWADITNAAIFPPAACSRATSTLDCNIHDFSKFISPCTV